MCIYLCVELSYSLDVGRIVFFEWVPFVGPQTVFCDLSIFTKTGRSWKDLAIQQSDCQMGLKALHNFTYATQNFFLWSVNVGTGSRCAQRKRKKGEWCDGKMARWGVSLWMRFDIGLVL